MSSYFQDLSVLSSCIDYKNLSAASKHVGLSQPQLSRIVKRLEEHFRVSLLDRSSPRHSSWTPLARGLCEVHRKSQKSLEHDLEAFLNESLSKELRLGCLEGLADAALKISADLLEQSHLERVILNLYDLNQLEAKFLSSELDLILSSRSPSKKKLKHEKTIGYQSLRFIENSDQDIHVLSTYEDNTKKERGPIRKSLISNSLMIRRTFAQNFGGRVLLPSPIHKEKSSLPEGKNSPVLLMAQDFLPETIWGQILKLKNLGVS